MEQLQAACPAKINLGLEVTGRRPDDYHELVTIFQAISLFDTLTVAPSDELTLTCSDPALATPANLCLTAARALRAATGVRRGARLHLEKRIPAAAGLGGGSSDAASTLRLLNQLWGTDLPDDEMAALAAALGADVPFFLNGPTALATGIGEQLDPLPSPTEAWFVLIRPAIDLDGKTARLYRALTPADWSDGARTRAQAARLRAGLPLDATLLVNVFRRPLLTEFPAVAEAEAALLDAGAEVVLPAGSGPTLAAICSSGAEAESLAARLRAAGWSPLIVHSQTSSHED